MCQDNIYKGKLKRHNLTTTQNKQLTRDFIMLSTLPHKPPHKLDKMENKSERCSQRWVFVVLHNKIVVLVLPYLIRVKLNLVKHVAEIKRMGHFSKLSYKKRTYQMN